MIIVLNKVISRIDFEECSLSDQLIMIEECCRVVEPNGTCYFFIDNNQLTNTLLTLHLCKEIKKTRR